LFGRGEEEWRERGKRGKEDKERRKSEQRKE